MHTLWNQLLLELSLNLSNTLQSRYRHIVDVHEEVWYRKKYFLANLQGFFLIHFSMTAPSNWWLIVYTLWNQLLLELLLDFFNTLKICCRHIEDVHEEVWCRKNIFWLTVCWRYQVSRTYRQVSFSLVLHKNICCGYSLESPRRGPTLCFYEENSRWF